MNSFVGLPNFERLFIFGIFCMQHLSRRSVFALLGSLAGSVVLSGCGFRLRGQFSAPFETLYLQMPENTRFSGLLKRVIESGSDVRVVTSPKEADAILELLSVNRSRDILSINDAGRAREYELTMTLEFRVVSPDGFDFVETTRLVTSRDLTYSESEFLSREGDEQVLYDDMENDLISQIVQRLGAAKGPSTDTP